MTETQKIEALAEANRLRHAAEVAGLRRENQALRDVLYDRFGLFVTTINPTIKMKMKMKQTMKKFAVVAAPRAISRLAMIGVAPACAGALMLATATTGCVSAITATGQGKVVTSVTETVLGLHVAEQTQNQTPEFDFGYTRNTVVLEPANTNAPIYVPPYANTFNFEQGSLLSFGLGESVASGTYQTAQPNSTNAITSQPIVAK